MAEALSRLFRLGLRSPAGKKKVLVAIFGNLEEAVSPPPRARVRRPTPAESRIRPAGAQSHSPGAAAAEVVWWLGMKPKPEVSSQAPRRPSGENFLGRLGTLRQLLGKAGFHHGALQKNQEACMAGGSPEGREEGALPSARGEPATRLTKKLLLLGVAFMASASRRKSRKFELAFEAIENLFGPLAAGLPHLTIPCGELAPQGTEEAQQIVGDRPELLALGWLLGTQAHGNPDLLGVATI